MSARSQPLKSLLNLFRPSTSRNYAKVVDVRIEVPRQAQREEIQKEYESMELNVFKKPLQLHGTRPLTGFMRTGYCEVPPGDYGNHSVAAVLTKEFLDFSASKGNDLRSAGLTSGCKWCLCASRWKEAFDARRGDDDPRVPKVLLNKTNEAALKSVELDELKKFAADKEE